MIGFTGKRVTTIGRVLALGFVLATLTAMVLSLAPAGAAVPSDKAFGWGRNLHGQLGNGANGAGTDTNTPGLVKNLTGVRSVKAGNYHGLALMNDGTVRAWGDNYFGQLGNGTFGTDSDVPVKVKNLTGVKAVSAGSDHNLALKENGTVWAWGYNGNGQLGNGTDGAGTDSNVPVKVASLGTGAKGIAAGDAFSLALMKDGTVKSWGYNGDGRLGNGTDAPRNTPGPVSNLSGVRAIATDSVGRHVLALLNDGTVKSWGENLYGQLGDGTTDNDRNTPVAVANLTNVRGITTGTYHSLAVLENGTVKSWGYNNAGQLGDGTSANAGRSAPGDAISLSNVRSVSGGSTHSLAVLDSGRVKSWGYNGNGELGNGETGTLSDTPGAVSNLTNVKNIDGGFGFTLAATQ